MDERPDIWKQMTKEVRVSQFYRLMITEYFSPIDEYGILYLYLLRFFVNRNIS